MYIFAERPQERAQPQLSASVSVSHANRNSMTLAVNEGGALDSISPWYEGI